MAPKCHRVTRWAGFQQATQSLSHVRYPTDTRQVTSPQGVADVQSLEGVWCRRHWGGWIHLAVDTASKGSPPLLEVRHTHTHTSTSYRIVRLINSHQHPVCLDGQLLSKDNSCLHLQRDSFLGHSCYDSHVPAKAFNPCGCRFHIKLHKRAICH